MEYLKPILGDDKTSILCKNREKLFNMKISERNGLSDSSRFGASGIGALFSSDESFARAGMLSKMTKGTHGGEYDDFFCTRDISQIVNLSALVYEHAESAVIVGRRSDAWVSISCVLSKALKDVTPAGNGYDLCPSIPLCTADGDESQALIKYRKHLTRHTVEMFKALRVYQKCMLKSAMAVRNKKELRDEKILTIVDEETKTRLSISSTEERLALRIFKTATKTLESPSDEDVESEPEYTHVIVTSSLDEDESSSDEEDDKLAKYLLLCRHSEDYISSGGLTREQLNRLIIENRPSNLQSICPPQSSSQEIEKHPLDRYSQINRDKKKKKQKPTSTPTYTMDEYAKLFMSPKISKPKKKELYEHMLITGKRKWEKIPLEAREIFTASFIKPV